MSWLDRLVRSIHRFGFPSWALFLAVFAFLATTIMIGKWTDGTVPFRCCTPAR